VPRPAATARSWLLALAACGDVSAPPRAGSFPLQPAGAADTAFAVFVDADSGLSTQDVYDVERQIVRFAAHTQAMVWADSGDSVSGWSTRGNDLRWARGGAFRVRFGEEGGERRAYFTEADRGTICDLEISAPEQLSLSPSSETPPQP
jgi:hypothetical protein